MNLNLKKLVGYFPSRVINSRLAKGIPGDESARLISLANRYPGFLGSVDRHIRVNTLFDFPIYCDRRSGIGQTLASEGKWEQLLSQTIQACLRPGDTAIDVGANIGYDTLLMSRAVGTEGIVISFEPVLPHFQLLMKNIRGMSAENVLPLSIGLSDRNGLAKIFTFDEYNTGKPTLRSGQTGPTQHLLVSRFDRLFERDELSRIAFLKIDIEGYELKALEGMGHFISRVDAASCEVNRLFLEQSGTSAPALISFMENHGFQTFFAEPYATGHWTRLEKASTAEILGRNEWIDALFVRNISDSLARLIGPDR